MQNEYQELWCLCYWTNPGHLGESKDYESYYTKPLQQGQKEHATPFELELVRSTSACQPSCTPFSGMQCCTMLHECKGVHVCE